MISNDVWKTMNVIPLSALIWPGPAPVHGICEALLVPINNTETQRNHHIACDCPHPFSNMSITESKESVELKGFTAGVACGDEWLACHGIKKSKNGKAVVCWIASEEGKVSRFPMMGTQFLDILTFASCICRSFLFNGKDLPIRPQTWKDSYKSTTSIMAGTLWRKKTFPISSILSALSQRLINMWSHLCLPHWNWQVSVFKTKKIRLNSHVVDDDNFLDASGFRGLGDMVLSFYPIKILSVETGWASAKPPQERPVHERTKSVTAHRVQSAPFPAPCLPIIDGKFG